MERETFFVDVILPLALPQLLTYRVPAVLNGKVSSGHRVVVQLGKNKLYTGIVNRIHQQVPQRYQAKYIEEVLDDYPIVNEAQLQLWEWISAYYCCTMGEVMNAALPSGLKLSSETKFTLSDETITEYSGLSEKEELLLSSMSQRETMTIQDIAALLDQKGVQHLVKGLIEKGIIVAEEEIKEKFRPKKTDFVKLGSAAQSEADLQKIFADLEKRRAAKQSDVMMCLLQLIGYDEKVRNGEVTRQLLQEKSGVNSSVISAMAEKQLLEIVTKETGRLGLHLLSSEKPKILSASQMKALREVEEMWAEKPVALLHGVTSSGKTEIYASFIQQMLDHGKQVLFLLPEIALTTQIIHRLKKYFGKRVGVYHSGYSENERTEVWNKVLSDIPGECDIILGARSALFLPYTRLGLVIVDEEHEHSFKQHDPAPRYHARDTAVVLAGLFDARVLLGSATPSIESYFNAKQERYGLVQMHERFGGIDLPEIIISDLRKVQKEKTSKSNFSPLLMSSMEEALAAGEQIILFQNRRGYSPLWQCHSCGWIPQCTRCDVSLTYHKQVHQLKCHYCGYATDPPQGCHACGSTDLRMLGFGTEKIEEDLQSLFPEIKIQRMDLDTTRSKSSYQKIITGFETGEIQVLVGTQMVTKGLDFDNVSLVGILHADRMMNYPDFRSMERSFQLMMQVAGRAGRRNKRGKVIIQTYTPDHWLLDLIDKGDYKGLYEHEMRERHHYGYPPFVRLVRITTKHKNDDISAQTAEAIAKQLKGAFGEKTLGPERPYVSRINNQFLWQTLVKLDKNPKVAENKGFIARTIAEVLRNKDLSGVRVVIDVDPL